MHVVRGGAPGSGTWGGGKAQKPGVGWGRRNTRKWLVVIDGLLAPFLAFPRRGERSALIGELLPTIFPRASRENL